MIDDKNNTRLTTSDATVKVPGATVRADGTVLADNNTTKLANAGETRRQSSAASGVQQPDLSKGAELLDLYSIESDAYRGGMGAVYKVRHKGWNAELALKRPHDHVFQTEEQKAFFIDECKHWIGLGLHPHIVSCYYVREIGGVPSIFAEWMDGGSLKNWIKDGRLYEGGENEQLIRILDIAIQFARGLHYSHERGLIHQDVKPDNLMMTMGGDAKVADFGLAHTRAVITQSVHMSSINAGTIMAESGGYTPAYASMEQLSGLKVKLTRRTDIFSWGVSVLEMLTGDRMWQSGTVAASAVNDYLDMAVVKVPEKLKDIIRKSVKEREEDRFRDFAEIESLLLDIYRSEAGEAYPREKTDAAGDTADSLNNKALSFLDIGEPENAEKCWETALSIAPNHLNACYNRGLYLWRSGSYTDYALLNDLRQADGGVHGSYLIAQVHIERINTEEALECLNDAKIISDDAELEKLTLKVKKLGIEGYNLETIYEEYGAKDNIFYDERGELFAVTQNNQGIPYSFSVYKAKNKEKLFSMTMPDFKTTDCKKLRSAVMFFKEGQYLAAAICEYSDGSFGRQTFKECKTITRSILRIFDVKTGKETASFDGLLFDCGSLCGLDDGRLAVAGYNLPDGNCIYFLSANGKKGCTLIIADASCAQILIKNNAKMYMAFPRRSLSKEKLEFYITGSKDPFYTFIEDPLRHIINVFVSEDFTHCILIDTISVNIIDTIKNKVVFSQEVEEQDKAYALARGGDFIANKKWVTLQLGICENYLSPDGKYFVQGSGGWDKLIFIWDLKQKKCLFSFNLANSVDMFYYTDSIIFNYKKADTHLVSQVLHIPKNKHSADWRLSKVKNYIETKDERKELFDDFADAHSAYISADYAKAFQKLCKHRNNRFFIHNEDYWDLYRKVTQKALPKGKIKLIYNNKINNVVLKCAVSNCGRYLAFMIDKNFPKIDRPKTLVLYDIYLKKIIKQQQCGVYIARYGDINFEDNDNKVVLYASGGSVFGQFDKNFKIVWDLVKNTSELCKISSPIMSTEESSKLKPLKHVASDPRQQFQITSNLYNDSMEVEPLTLKIIDSSSNKNVAELLMDEDITWHGIIKFDSFGLFMMLPLDGSLLIYEIDREYVFD